MISGFQASDIGQYGIDDLSWYTGGFSNRDVWVNEGAEASSWFGGFTTNLFPMGYPRYPYQPQYGPAPRESLPEVLPGSAAGEESQGGSTASGSTSVYSDGTPADTWVDPEEGLGQTVFESPVPYQPDYRSGETDWDWVYERYRDLNPEEAPVIWDDVAGYFDTAVGWYDTLAGPNRNAIAPSYPNMGTLAAAAQPLPQQAAPGAPMAAGGACGPSGPRYGKICLATGVVTPLKRRRRRRLLTSGDLSDLAAAKSIIGGGAGLNALVVKAVRR